MPAHRSRLVPSRAHDELVESLRRLRDKLDLPPAFPEEVEAEAQRVVASVPMGPGSKLADLRDLDFLTIDPAGSTDLDQALHIERTPAGAVLHYAIADVPAFVRPGGAVDDEARRRGQTLYAIDGRVPLHPASIGDGAASLLPGVERRAFVWRFRLDDEARPVEASVRRATIRSRTQWSYADAQAAIDAGTAPPSLSALAWLGPLRLAQEAERGGASLNVPETRIVAAGDRYRLERDAALPVEDWNAQVSLMTGMAAAEMMIEGRVGILRTMPAADPADLAAFRAQTSALGIPWRPGIRYGDYLRGLDRRAPAALAILDAAAGLFRGAGYAAFDGEAPADPVQAAIGAPYAHTTAPLRRLVDRWSLVVCAALSAGAAVPAWARESLPSLPGIMDRSDGLANRLEAASLDRVEAALLSGSEGAVFDAVVLGRRNGGARVQVVQPPVTAKVAGLDADPGATVRLRLRAADIATGTVVLEATA